MIFAVAGLLFLIVPLIFIVYLISSKKLPWRSVGDVLVFTLLTWMAASIGETILTYLYMFSTGQNMEHHSVSISLLNVLWRIPTLIMILMGMLIVFGFSNTVKRFKWVVTILIVLFVIYILSSFGFMLNELEFGEMGGFVFVKHLGYYIFFVAAIWLIKIREKEVDRTLEYHDDILDA